LVIIGNKTYNIVGKFYFKNIEKVNNNLNL